MRMVTQLVAVAVLFAAAVPLAARFVPGSRPWLDRAGLLAPLAQIGVLPAEAAVDGGDQGGGGQGGGGRGGDTPVVAAPADIQALRDVVTAIGSAEGARSVVLLPEISGRVTAIHATPGERVEAGAIILDLDSGTAELMVARAQLVFDDAQATIRRMERLAGSGTVTDLQRQDAELALRTAELALRTAERDLADHSLRAPVAGFVGLIEVQPGDLVTPATAVTRIEDRSSLIVDFRVPERVASLIAVGDPVEASPVSQPGKTIAGRILAVDNRVDEASRTLRAQAAIGNDDDALRAGMAFRITFAFTGDDYPAVDPLAIQWGSDGAFIWLVRAGKAERLPIRILQRNADAVLIEAALRPDDLVVTEGVQSLRPGAAVTVIPGPRS